MLWNYFYTVWLITSISKKIKRGWNHFSCIEASFDKNCGINCLHFKFDKTNTLHIFSYGMEVHYTLWICWFTKILITFWSLWMSLWMKCRRKNFKFFRSYNDLILTDDWISFRFSNCFSWIPMSQTCSWFCFLGLKITQVDVTFHALACHYVFSGTLSALIHLWQMTTDRWHDWWLTSLAKIMQIMCMNSFNCLLIHWSLIAGLCQYCLYGLLYWFLSLSCIMYPGCWMMSNTF